MGLVRNGLAVQPFVHGKRAVGDAEIKHAYLCGMLCEETRRDSPVVRHGLA